MQVCMFVFLCITGLCSLKGCLESSEDSVREFLEVSEEHNKDEHIQNRTHEKDVNVSSLSKDSKQLMTVFPIPLVR